MSKPFFFRIESADLLNFATDPEGEGMSLLRFAKELQKGESEIEFIQDIIDEARNYIEKKKKAGSKGGKAKASSAIAVLGSAVANASTPLARSSTVHKPKPLVLKDETSTRVIEYLNAKTGKSYKTDTAATIKLIKARLKEGFIPEDFKTAIDNQCREWLNDPEYEKYLRPATLFIASKFDGYLQNTKATPTGEHY